MAQSRRSTLSDFRIRKKGMKTSYGRTNLEYHIEVHNTGEVDIENMKIAVDLFDEKKNKITTIEGIIK